MRKEDSWHLGAVVGLIIIIGLVMRFFVIVDTAIQIPAQAISQDTGSK